MHHVVILDGARTPFGRFGGSRRRDGRQKEERGGDTAHAVEDAAVSFDSAAWAAARRATATRNGEQET